MARPVRPRGLRPGALLAGAALVLSAPGIAACTTPGTDARTASAEASRAAGQGGAAAVPGAAAEDVDGPGNLSPEHCFEQVHGLTRLSATARGETVELRWSDTLVAASGRTVYHVYRRPEGAEVGDWTPMSYLELARADSRRYVDPVPVGTADYGITVDGACGQVPLCEDGPCVRIRYEPSRSSRGAGTGR